MPSKRRAGEEQRQATFCRMWYSTGNTGFGVRQLCREMLVKHGDSSALAIDKPTLEMLPIMAGILK
ncbi:MAG: hypothetical protein IT422_25580 [Pirellulaceae bacterium]|nr:hypothetical protein [Pirellulaceae bacterium]